jgi:hypothetical protein
MSASPFDRAPGGASPIHKAEGVHAMFGRLIPRSTFTVGVARVLK